MIMKHHSRIERQIIIDNLMYYYKNILTALPSSYDLSHFTDDIAGYIYIYEFKCDLINARMYTELFNFKKLEEKGFYSCKNLDEIIIKLNPDYTEYGQYPTISWCSLESILNFDEEKFEKEKDESFHSEYAYEIGLAYKLREGHIDESDLSEEDLRNARKHM